jgi:hypothetical protein
MRRLMAALAVAAIVAGAVQADPVVFDRGLPVYNAAAPNLNNAAGANRSNVAWADSDYATGWFTGDNFTIAGAGQTTIKDLTVWVAGTGDLPSYDTFTLWTGLDTGTVGTTTVTELRTSTVGGADLVFTPATYSNGETYQRSSGAWIPLYELTFQDLNWTVDNGTSYAFGVSGADASENLIMVSLHASNAALSNSMQEGADGAFYGFDNGTLAYIWDTAPGADGGWDKSSDINVRITAVPVPGALLLGLFGLGNICLIRRKRA